MALGDVISRLAVSLNLETAAFDKNARAATGTVGKMQASMAKAAGAIAGAFAGIQLGAAVSAFRDMTKAALDSAGGLGEQAAQIGVSTKALQEYRFAATQVGLSTQEMELGLQQLTRRLGDAAQGAKAPSEALERLGLSVEQIRGMDTGDVIPLIAQGIAALPDPAQRAAVAVDLFGKSGQKLLPLLENGAAGVEAFRIQAQQLGVVLSEGEIAKADETADKLAALNYQIEAQQNKKLLENADAVIAYEEAIGSFKLAAITAVGDLERANQRYNAWALEFNANLRSAINGVVAFAASLPAKFREAASKAISAAASIGANIVLGIARGIRQSPEAVWNALKSVISSGITNAKAFLGIKSPSRVFMEIGDYIGQGLAIGIEGSTGRVTAATKKMTDAARKAAEETQALFARLFPEIEQANQYRADLARIAGAGVSDDAKDAARTRLGREVTGMTGDVPLSDAVMNQGPLVDIDIDAVNRGLKESLGLTDKLKAGWASLKDVGASAFNELAYQLKGVLLGAQSLGDALKNLVASLADMALSMAFKALGTSIGIPGFANGTNYAPGGLALVGERGPELVNLRRGSQVIPNHELGGMMGRGNTINIYQQSTGNERMDRANSAMTARSIKQRLNA